MEIINYIYLTKGKIYLSNACEYPVEINKFISDYGKDTNLYILDYDGITKNKPNINIYQRLSSFSDLWIDGGPRSTGDVIDFVMAGANKITIRKDLSDSIDIAHLRELSESKFYLAIKENLLKEYDKLSNIGMFDGIVVLLNEKRRDIDFISISYLKNFASKNEIYLFNSGFRPKSHWEKMGISGLFSPVSQKKEV